jgi:hypothetical protein
LRAGQSDDAWADAQHDVRGDRAARAVAAAAAAAAVVVVVRRVDIDIERLPAGDHHPLVASSVDDHTTREWREALATAARAEAAEQEAEQEREQEAERRRGYSDAKVANRDIGVWHGATETGP